LFFVESAIDKGNIIPLNFNILGSPALQTPNVEVSEAIICDAK